MSEPLNKVSIFLDESGPSKYVLILDHNCNRFIRTKISTAREIYDRNYRDMLNSYMFFSVDCCAAFNLAKSDKNLKPFSYSSKDIPILWENSPKDVKDEYEKIFIGFKNLKPKVKKFVSYNPPEKNTNDNFNNKFQTELESNQTEYSTPVNYIYQSENSPSDVNAFFDYVEEDGFIPSPGGCLL